MTYLIQIKRINYHYHPLPENDNDRMFCLQQNMWIKQIKNDQKVLKGVIFTTVLHKHHPNRPAEQWETRVGGGGGGGPP
jgi:hypothetical protein